MTESVPDERFWRLAGPLLDQAGVTRSTMMGYPCLRLDGDFFACCDRRTGNLVVKLTEARATELIEAGKAEPFAPNGRRFREWVSIPARTARRWPALLDEALSASARRRSAPRSPGHRSAKNQGKRTVGERALERVRAIALALPEVNERLSHGEPCFFVRDRRPLCYFHDDHKGDGRVALWCPTPPGVQEELVSAEPERFFKLPASARGVFATWLGVYLDTAGTSRVDWKEIAAIIEDAYRNVAPGRFVEALDNRRNRSRRPRRAEQ
jgi:hypothetical protein